MSCLIDYLPSMQNILSAWIEVIVVLNLLSLFFSDITALAKGRAYTHNLNGMTVYQVTVVASIFPFPWFMQ